MGLVTPYSIPLDLDPAARVFGDPAAARAAPRGWDFLGSTPVPLRARMRDELGRTIQALRGDGLALKCCMPMGQGGRTPFERLRHIRDLADFPKLLVSAEHGNAFNRTFHAEHVERGAFASGQPEGAAEVFAEAGLIDPQGWIGVYAVAPFVLLVDLERLGARPVPGCWSDLADPVYRGEVVFSGWRRGGGEWASYNLFFLLAMLRMLGPTGLRRLLANVPGLIHSAQMPRLAGAGGSLGALYVLPWSLADLCPRRDRAKVVWPRDGALAYPLWMTAQSAHRERLAPLIDTFFAPEMARYLDHNLYPSLAPGARAAVPARTRLNWLGWDYLRSRAAAGDIKQARAIFLESRIGLESEDRQCA